MRPNVVLKFLSLILFTLVFLPKILYAGTTTISGTISLPAGVSASQSNTRIDVNFGNWNGSDFENFTNCTTATLGAGETSVTYSCDINTASEYIGVSAHINDFPGVYRDAFYNHSGTVWISQTADKLPSGSDLPNVDLTLLKASTITGKISLPQGVQFPEEKNLHAFFMAWDDQGNSGQFYCSDTVLPANSASTNYTCQVPGSMGNIRMYIRTENLPGFVVDNFYNSSGTVFEQTSAEEISSSTDHQNIDVSLLQAISISGTISLPQGILFPENKNLHVFFIAQGSQGGTGEFWCNDIVLPANAATASYTCQLPSSTNDAGVMIRAEDMPGIAVNNYYRGSGTTFEENQAEWISSATDHQNIDVTLLQAKTISGTISLTQGIQYAEEKRIGVFFLGWNAENEKFEDQYWCEDVNLPANSTAVEYSCRIPGTIAEVGIYVRAENFPGVMKNNYYKASGTVWEEYEADRLSSAGDHQNIDVALIGATTISGTLSLPQGVPEFSEEKSFDVSFMIWNSKYSFFDSEIYCAHADLPAGNRSVAYSCAVPKNTSSGGIQVHSSDAAGIVGNNYYNSGGTTWSRHAAERISPSADISDINLTLLRATTISGSIHTPDNQTFEEEKNIYVFAVLKEPNSTSSQWINADQQVLPAGETSFVYSITVPEGVTNANVSYDIYDDIPGIWAPGFYGAGGETVPERDAAAPLNTSNDNPNINLTLIKGMNISGTLSLQGSDTFGNNQNIGFEVMDKNYNFIAYEQFETTPDANSIPFSLTIPPVSSSFTITYYGSSGMESYPDYGYFTTNGSGATVTPCIASATWLTKDDVLTGLEISLTKQPTITGTVSLPTGVASADIPIKIGLSYPDTNGHYSGDFYNGSAITILSGKSSTPYSVTVSPSCGSSPVLPILGYRQTNNSYVRYGYYATTGTKGDPQHATPLAEESKSNVNLKLMTGKTLAGTISVQSALGNDLPVTLGALVEREGLYHTTVTMPAGQRTVPYSVRFADDVASVALSYWLPEDVPLATMGYFRQNTPTTHVTGLYSSADKTLAGNKTGLNFTLAEGDLVSGAITIPEAVNRPVPIVVSLAVDPVDPDSIYWHSAIIVKKGTTSATYQRRVILDSPAVAMFLNNYERDWTPKGFFKSPAESVSRFAKATKLLTGQTLTETNLIISPKFVEPGDVNFDGEINLTDVILSLKVLTNAPDTTGKVTNDADVDGDKQIGMPETLYILKEVSAP